MAAEPAGNDSDSQKDDVVAALEAAIHAFVRTKRRYQLLVAAASELDRLTDTMNVRRADGNETPIRNDAVLQLVRDCFDMFVIDLASIREGLVEPMGVLNRIKENPSRLTRCDASKLAPRPVMVIGGDDHERVAAEVDACRRELVAKGINEALERLVPGEYPVTPEGITKLIAKFIKATDPVDKDRNHVRAHRYEHRPFDRHRHFQPLPAHQDQLDLFEQLLGDLYLVLTRNSYHLELRFQASHSRTAHDLADLMVHGSINEATRAYGVVRKCPDNPVPWYYFHREKFFDTPSEPQNSEPEPPPSDRYRGPLGPALKALDDCRRRFRECIERSAQGR